MRALVAALTGAALLPGCLGPSSHHCGGDVWCPSDFACVAAPTYCAPREDVEACGAAVDGAACATSTVAHGVCSGGACTACTPDQIACSYDGWVAMQSPLTSNLKGVAALGATEVYAVSEVGDVLRYDGRGWSSFTAPVPPVALTGIWAGRGANDRTELYATGIDQLWHFDGSAWAPVALPGAGTLIHALWGASVNDVHLARDASILRWDGATWTAQVTGGIRGIHGRDASDVVAVGIDGRILELGTDGTTWMAAAWTVETGTIFEDVWVGRDGAAVAVGADDASTAIVAMRPATRGAWTEATLPTATPLACVSGSGADQAVAGGNLTLLHLEAGAWTSAPLPAAASINALSAGDAGDVFAVGNGGVIWRFRPAD